MLTFRYDEWPMPLRPPPQPTMAVASTSAVTMDEDLPAFARKGLEKEERCAVCLQVRLPRSLSTQRRADSLWTPNRTTRMTIYVCSATAITASTPTASERG